MSERFFFTKPIAGNQAVLVDTEAHHFLHVMRGGVGDRVTLFDGNGSEFVAEVTACRRSVVELTVGEAILADRELSFKLTVGVALPKSDRQKWLVEKLTELGVTQMVPLKTDRGVAQPTPKALERLRKSTIEACKQCGRNRLMELAPATQWSAFACEAVFGTDSDCDFDCDSGSVTKLFAHPGGEPVAEVWPRVAGECTVAIGPEGGFTDDEVDLATTSGWQAVSLGPRILRVETAAVALAAMATLTAR